MIKRYGNSPKRGQSYKLRPGAYAILPRDGQLLLTYQDDPHFEFQLPGGGIDPGESPIQARRFVYMPEYDLNAEKVCHIYLARPVRPHGPPSEKGHHAVWMDPRAAIHELSNDGDAAFVAGLID